MKLKLIPILLPVLMLPFTGRAQTLVTSDSVSGTWTAAGSPYLITRNIAIPPKTTLQIDPGTEVHFLGNYAITVDGKLLAIGTAKKTITFAYADSAELAGNRKNRDSLAANINGWRGIRFSEKRDAADTSLLTFCTLKGSKALTGQSNDCVGGAISIKGHGLVMIKNCTLTGNQAHIGGAIYCMGCDAYFSGNIIAGNKSLSDGGAICFIDCMPVFKNNIVRDNTSPEFGGGIYCYRTGGTFVNNIITRNSARFGGAMSLQKSDLRLLNNTIADNRASVNGGGIHCQESDPFIKNTILWGNSAQEKGKQLYLYRHAYPDILYSDIENGYGGIERFNDTLAATRSFEHTLDENPKFLNNDTAYYSLADTSPCIDAGLNTDDYVSEGVDLKGNPRIINRIVDLGAQEFSPGTKKVKKEQEEKQEQKGTDKRTFVIYPNPNKGKFTIEISGKKIDGALLSIINGSGQEVYVESIPPGSLPYIQVITLDADYGVYFLQLTGTDGKLLKKEKLVIQ